MKKIISLSSIMLLMVLVACSEGSSGDASDYPRQPVTITIPYGAGGTTDMFFREFADIAEEHLGQNIMIENETGGGGLSMYSSLVSAEPDGYTMAGGMGNTLYAINPHLDLMEQDGDDFTHILPVMGYQYVIVASTDAPFQTFDELIEYSKNNSIDFATPSMNNTIFAELINQEENFDLQWNTVNYEDDGETLAAILGGHVDFAITSPVSVSGAEEAGDINFLAVTHEEEIANYPDVSTLQDLDYNLDLNAMIGIGGPDGLPDEVVSKWEEVISKTLEDPRLEEFAENNSYSIPEMDRQEAEEHYEDLREQFGEVIDRVTE
ncbi:tripartite tricarboxylate transporter substrate binding protein [Salicibibacter kimchii]|uniref:Tripartite tricarboxylate transporter substrate binding protein n=1 Tax=Salicibibacter kimchii TaxID=2099786 RepID=A0A345BWQ0_9BACI|nr:tripartite tricarboxylate transporter substrate binding protein [Salicibibacter kimchii]AXF55381.1 tripartite tricarboxylate transporter substrate binding protein [Salicibibacter kimchii]